MLTNTAETRVDTAGTKLIANHQNENSMINNVRKRAGPQEKP